MGTPSSRSSLASLSSSSSSPSSSSSTTTTSTTTTTTTTTTSTTTTTTTATTTTKTYNSSRPSFSESPTDNILKHKTGRIPWRVLSSESRKLLKSNLTTPLVIEKDIGSKGRMRLKVFYSSVKCMTASQYTIEMRVDQRFSDDDFNHLFSDFVAAYINDFDAGAVAELEELKESVSELLQDVEEAISGEAGL